MFGIGAGEFILIVVAGLILFGPSKLPELGRAIGKGLKEFRKAQAALSATLNEVSVEQSAVSSQQSEKKSSAEDKKVSLEKNFSEQKTPSRMTADDVINLAKESPTYEENMHEKIFNSNVDNSATADGGKGNVDSRINSNGDSKKSEPAKN